MREDMGKVVTERPRHGLRTKYPKGYNRANKLSEESPTKESMRKKWHQAWNGAKEVSDLIGPLYRYLYSKIGFNWDDTYSEISECLPVNGMDGVHIRQHVDMFVEKNIQVIDGIHKASTGLSIYKDFYVDEEGLLRKTPERIRKKPYRETPNPLIRWINETECYSKLNNIWYWVKVKPFKPKINRHTNNKYWSYALQTDPITKGTCSHKGDLFWRKDVIGIEKRPLNSREIKKAALNKPLEK